MYLYCKQAGFSLFELIITVAIVSILAFICVPTYHNWAEKQEFDSINALTQQYFSYAKNQALILHVPIVICSSDDLIQCKNDQWNKGVIIFTDHNRNKRVDPEEKILYKTEHNIKYGQLTWKGSASSTHVLTLQGDTGLPRGAPGSFFYCSQHTNEHHRRYYVSRMGMIRHEPMQSCEKN